MPCVVLYWCRYVLRYVPTIPNIRRHERLRAPAAIAHERPREISLIRTIAHL